MSFVISALYLVAALLGATFAFFELRLLTRFVRHRHEVRETVRSHRATNGRAIPSNGSTPSVTIQIPLYNERTTAEQVILAAAAQDYPSDHFDIQVLDDSTDETPLIVGQLVSRLHDQGVRIQHLRRDERAGYKAGALAEGLKHSAAGFVAIFDADFTPDPSFLRRLLLEEDAFQDPKVAFAQARWSWNESLQGFFHSAIGLLMDRHFFVQKPTKAFMGDVTAFNGSAGIWRRAAIDAVGGWSTDSLTEDLDLSYRCALSGWRGRYLQDVTVPSDLPGDMRAFKLQQHRWARGNAQCFRKLTGRVLRSKGVIRDRWEEAHLLAGYAIHPILLANLLLWPWAVVGMDRTLFIVLQIFLSVLTLVAPLSFLLALKERGDSLSIRSAVLIGGGVCLGLGLMAANTVGQIQGLLSRKGEFARTPKPPRFAAASELRHLGANRAYASPLHWTFFLELLVILYCVAGLRFLVDRGEVLWAFPLLFWALCLGMVVVLQWMATARRVPSPALP
ncbi:MAG: glycosyltransferase [Gemmatimonadetes bacterium]|nr:glycosyltransferase [Gemmatimonadota bacterium]